VPRRLHRHAARVVEAAAGEAFLLAARRARGALGDGLLRVGIETARFPEVVSQMTTHFTYCRGSS
jgi:hypothetical protein